MVEIINLLKAKAELIDDLDIKIESYEAEVKETIGFARYLDKREFENKVSEDVIACRAKLIQYNRLHLTGYEPSRIRDHILAIYDQGLTLRTISQDSDTVMICRVLNLDFDPFVEGIEKYRTASEALAKCKAEREELVASLVSLVKTL